MSLKSLSLIVLAAVGLLASPAFAAEHEGASSDTVKYNAAVQLEVGGALLNNAVGNHPLKLYGGVRAHLRPNYLFTLTGGYGLAYVTEGPNELSYTNLLHKVYGRVDMAWGTTTRQFYIGAGPAFFANQFSVTDGSTTEKGLLMGPGFVYATGLRIVLGDGRLPVAFEFGGQYHHERMDFLVTIAFGLSIF